MPVSQPSPTASTRFLDIRKRLLDTGLYLGDRLLQNNVHWVRDGRADRLAIKVTKPKGSEDGKEALPALPSPPPGNGSFDFALISAIVEIDTMTPGLLQMQTTMVPRTSGQTTPLSSRLAFVRCLMLRHSWPTGVM